MDSRTELALLDALKGGGFLASVITTFNAYLPFYEHVVLPKLRAAGSRHNIVLIDAGECAKALAQPETAPRLAGRAYTLVPIESPGAFHPKLFLLLGKNKSALHVGSHNLTLSGFGKNGELTSLVTHASREQAGPAEVGEAWAAISQWVQREAARLPSEVGGAIKATERLVPWLAQARSARRGAGPSRLLIQSLDGRSLWEQVSPLLPSRLARLSVVGAFFDTKIAFLDCLQRATPGAPMHIAIQPTSVSLPCSPAIAMRFDWRDGSSLAESGYLHAKAVWFEARDEQDLLLLGSANPSAPAWLMPTGQRNDEAMFMVQGQEARQAAKELGLISIRSLPKVSAEELREITNRSIRVSHVTEIRGRALVGALVNEQLTVRAEGLRGRVSGALFIGAAGETIGRASSVRQVNGSLVVEVPKSVSVEQVVSVRLTTSEGGELVAIVHRPSEIAELSRTGTQQALRAALEGLEDEASDLSELVAIVERAIFSDISADLPEQVSSRGKESAISDRSKRELPRPESLVVSTKEMKAPNRRRRLLGAGGDLAYLLDVLFKELRTDGVKRELDQHGRSEEEQIGKDDDVPTTVRVDDAALARLCQSKATRLVKRAIRYVEESSASSEPRQWLSAIVKLTAVLAVLRELRVIEQLPRWRVVHAHLVGPDALDLLLDGVMPVLFGRDAALLLRAQAAIGSESYEELARLKGLLLWLAWDSRVVLEDHFSLMDEPDALFVKLWEKAALLEIAQYLPGDDLALQEAHQSVMRCASAVERVSAAKWLERVAHWCRQVEGLLLQGRGAPKPISQAEVGDLAYVTSSREPRARVIFGKDASTVSLCDLGSEGGHISYSADRVMGLALASGSSRSRDAARTR